MPTAAHSGKGPGPNHLNGRPKRTTTGMPLTVDARRPRPGRTPSDEDLAFVDRGLSEMNRLAEECMRLTRRMEELEPAFREAAMAKAKILMVIWAVGCVVILVSFLWTGTTAIVFRVGLVAALAGVYFLPVHLFVGGNLREKARQWRRLDKKSLSGARRMATIGVKLNRDLRKRLSGSRTISHNRRR